MPYKILAIDDHPQTLDIVIITLQQHGYSTVGSSEPLQAIAIAEKERPDLILLDMNMPEMNGKEVCRRLRAHPQFATTPIIMFSAEATEKMAGFEVGADDFLVKPTDPEELIARIEGLLEKAAHARKSGTQDQEHKDGEGDMRADAEADSGISPAESSIRQGEKRFVAVLGVRGGSGATTLATNLAVSAADLGYRTTLVDFDMLQGHVGLLLKARMSAGMNGLAGLKDELIGQHLSKALVKYSDNLLLLLSRPNPFGRLPMPSPAQIAIIADAVGRSSQFVVADLGHQITGATRVVVEGATQVIVCVRPERLSLSAAKVMLQQLEQTVFSHTRISVMLFGLVGGLNLPKHAIEGFLGHPVLAIIPPMPKEMLLALNKGVPFVHLFPRTDVAMLFRQVAKQSAKQGIAQ